MSLFLLHFFRAAAARCGAAFQRGTTLTATALLLGGGSVASGDEVLRVATVESMKKMSLEELLSIEVTTMSRKEELWWSAPGAIEVVTSEEIRRSGARNLPEALRLGTGVDVAQPSARSWAVSTRGFNVLAANKISVLMDGRSLFTPFFSGVQWDAQDTMLEDIDRIEIVRGPVGALWGSYAVNGFIQIVTKSADQTQGWLSTASTGTDEPLMAAVRYGGRAGSRTFYRVYAKYLKTDWTRAADGSRTQDAVDFGQVGFRTDSFVDGETTVTVQGDAYTNKGLPDARAGQQLIAGANVLARVRRVFSAESDFEVMSYFDYTDREIISFWQEERQTASVTAKYRRPAGVHDLLFGADLLVSSDDIAQLGFATMSPQSRTTHSIGVYAQDTVMLSSQISGTLGAKVEHNSFSGLEFAPSIRGAYTPTPNTTLWGAVSRAVRPPVRIDQNLVLAVNGTPLLEAGDHFDAENVIAYELGWRHRWGDRFTADVAVFYNEYDKLRTTEPRDAAALPLTFKNNLQARSHGVETALHYQPTARVLFKVSHRYLDLDWVEQPGTRDIAHGINEGNDPKHIFSVTAHVDLPASFEFDATLRHVSSRPNPASEGFTVADLRLAWVPAEEFEIALMGHNLFHGLHREIVTTNSLNEFIGPSATIRATLRY